MRNFKLTIFTLGMIRDNVLRHYSHVCDSPHIDEQTKAEDLERINSFYRELSDAIRVLERRK